MGGSAQGGGNGKASGSNTNTGQPAWTSGAGAYAPPWGGPGSATAAGPAGGAPLGAPPPANFAAWQQQYQPGQQGQPQQPGQPPPQPGQPGQPGQMQPPGMGPGMIGGVGTPGAPQQGGGMGAAPEPGSDAYNQMNTQLQTSPMQALVGLFQNGGANADTQTAIKNLLGTSGANQMMNQAGQMFQNLGQQGTQNFQNVYNAAGQPGSNQQNLSNIASGGMMMSNPYIDAIANRNKQDAMSGVNAMYAAGGRYGSGYNQDALTSAIGNVNNQLYGQAYENDANRQLTAANQISQEQQGRMGIQNNAAQGVGGLQTSAAQGLGGLGTSAMQNWLTAQQNAGQLGTNATQNMLQGMGQLNNVQQNKLFDANQQLGVGNATTQQTQQQMNDLQNQWTQGDMADWARTGALMGAGTQSAGNWGTTTGNQSNTSKAGMASIIGGILGML